MSLQWMSPRWMSVQWMPLQCNGCHCKWISRQWMSFDGCHISQQRESHRKEISQHRGLIEGCLEVKLPTIWTDGKAQVGRVREEKRREDERRSKKRKPQKKEDPGGNVAKHCVFRMICGSGGLKSRLAKAAGAEPPGQIRDEKLHAVVARSTFPSQNVQNTPCSDHFWNQMESDVVSRGRCKGLCTLSKVSKI